MAFVLSTFLDSPHEHFELEIPQDAVDMFNSNP